MKPQHLMTQARQEFPELLRHVPDTAFLVVWDAERAEPVGLRIRGRFLWIRPELRRQGLALAVIREDPAEKIVIDPSNEASVALYTKAGYVRSDLKGDGPLEIWEWPE